MTITSLYYLAFVLLTLIVYYVFPKKLRWTVLLAASAAFYGIVCLKYIPFIIFTILSTWAGGIWLDRYNSDRQEFFKANKSGWDSEKKKAYKHTTMIRKRLILSLVLVVNFGILAVLKYYDFMAGWLGSILNFQAAPLGILLPLGISFYTFQTMGYIIDVYWEKTAPLRNPAKFALFAMYFPQIIQGPIAIYNDLTRTLYEGHELKFENIKYGFQLALWGLFKKMVIADRLILMTDALSPVRNEVSNGYSLLLVIVYAAQLYMDFSGGIDIVRGVSRMFGIEMAINFKRPFFSKSVAEFWQRWHISLCHWLKTYLFYPIAVSRAFLRFGRWISARERHPDVELPEDSIWGGYTFLQHLGRVLPGCIATLITFFIIGMWHGANWKYAGYGLWNGIIILAAKILEPFFRWVLERLGIRTDTSGWRIWQILRTVIIVGLSFAFDVADNMADSLKIIWKCITPALGPTTHLGHGISIGLELPDILVAVTGLVIVFAVSLYQERSKQSVRVSIDRQPMWISWILTLGCAVAVAVFGMYGPGISTGEFVYMQF